MKTFTQRKQFSRIVERASEANGWKDRRETVVVECELTVDVDGLIEDLGRKATRNKSKKSSEVGGLVVVRVSNERPL